MHLFPAGTCVRCGHPASTDGKLEDVCGSVSKNGCCPWCDESAQAPSIHIIWTTIYPIVT